MGLSPVAVTSTYCDEEILLVVNHYGKLLSQNVCNIEEIPQQWDCVKAYLESILKSQTKIDYLEVCRSIFTIDNVKRECKNILHVIELLLITPFTNAKLEHVFSCMNGIETKLHNPLGQERLDTQICIGEEGGEYHRIQSRPIY